MENYIKKGDYVDYLGIVIQCLMCDKETIYFVNGTKAKRNKCNKVEKSYEK